eukprot:3760547-Prymnesium_polylepis.1
MEQRAEVRSAASTRAFLLPGAWAPGRLCILQAASLPPHDRYARYTRLVVDYEKLTNMDTLAALGDDDFRRIAAEMKCVPAPAPAMCLLMHCRRPDLLPVPGALQKRRTYVAASPTP